MAKEPGKPLTKIKSSLFSRGAALTKLVVQSGTRLASAKVKEAVGGSNMMDEVFRQNAHHIVTELGRLKGSAMKVGQSLAMVSEHFLPKDVSQILGRLNEESEPVAWESMSATLQRALPKQVLAELDIDPKAFASASLGQVHRAVIRATGEDVCMKIQYPGVADSIDSDLMTIRALFKVSKIVPHYGEKLDAIFAEVKAMLKQETDYIQEAQSMTEFAAFLGDDPRFVVPKHYPRYSCATVITTAFSPGLGINDPEVARLPRKRRSRLAAIYAELFLRELFLHGKIQTDPHYGNYKVRLSPSGEDQLILLDFGAMRRYPRTFMEPYIDLVRGALARHEAMVLGAAESMGFIHADDSASLKRQFVEFCYLVVEPWVTVETPQVLTEFFGWDGFYDWGESDLPQRIAQEVSRLSLAFKFRPPPQEVVFLDRRLAGVFTALKCFDAPFDAHGLVVTALGWDSASRGKS